VATRTLIVAGRYDEARQLLLPLVNESKVWRDLWLNTALELPDATRCELWLSEVTPPDLRNVDRETARALGEAWGRLAYQSGRASALERARALLLPLAQREDATAGELLRAGQLELVSGNLDASEDLLRRSLRMAPEQPEATNNLAYVLLRRGERLDEARVLAEESVRRNRRVAAYHDTLARVLMAQGRRDEARKSFEQAVALDGSCLDAWIGLALLHHAEGRPADVTATLRKIDELLERSPPPTDPVRRELETLRAQLSHGAE
jgi:tetratricopeptide (TPR) repeat protein